VSRRWVAYSLGMGLLAACSGSNAVVPFGEPDAATVGLDAAPTADATMATDEDGSNHASDASGDASSEPPHDATVEDAPEAGTEPDAGNGVGADDGGSDDDAPDAPSCPVASTAGNAFVDGALGADDDSHGGSPGACAYKTITFAVARATRSILVAAGTYSEANGETLPLVLTGRQGILCTDATIEGQGHSSSMGATVVFDGTANVLSDCTLVGDDAAGACVLVESDGSRSGHDIESVDASHCGDAAVRVTGTLVEIQDSNFHDSDRGIWWNGQTSGDMSNNTFSNNSIDDIACDDGDADPGVTGSNNTDGSGDPSCDVCGACPFD